MTKTMTKLILKLVLLNLVVISGLAEYLSLDGKQWNAINQNKTIKAPANVPGSIYSDLRKANVLKEDIFKEYNDVNYRWVSYDNWTYERTFNVDSSLLSKQSVHLVAHGIDTVSTVYVNDKVVGETDNQFIRYKFDVKKVLKTGENKIKIEFISAQIYGKQKFEEYKQKYGYDVPPDCPASAQLGECHYNFIRKMQSSFSWDWGPAFPTQGIWKPIGIEAYDKAIIRDITVKTTPNPKDRSEWTLTVYTYLESATLKDFDAIFNIELDGHKLITNQKWLVKPQVPNGMAEMVFVIPIRNITIFPWYPNGVSKDMQKLYKLKVDLSFEDSKEFYTTTKRIGFRQIELIQTPIKPKGLTFNFQVNGDTFWAKGTNWIPAHLLMEELTPEYVRHLMLSAKEANMNMMRVWGGGVYESDLFYELADELGIMIWQDMMFACALYPTDKDFLKTVDTEVRQQIKRLQHHPSIAIWAGNNENEAALSSPWYPVVKSNETLYRKDYVELYIDTIKPIVLSEDSTRSFVSSSPSNGLEDEKEKWVANNPGDERYGDLHYYNYDIKLWDWKSFPSPKFASEYGFQSYPSLEAFTEVLDQKELTFPVSKAVDHRQHHGGGDMVMEDQASRYFKLPSKGGSDRFNDMIYLSQITQAMAMKTETEFYRRNRVVDPKTGKGNTMGALYWQINDVWQAPTWASIEFGGKWKMLHNYAKNFLDNTLVSPYEDTNQTLKVSLVRDDYYGDLDFDLSVKVYKWSENKAIHEIKTKVKTQSFSAPIVFTKSIPELLNESKCKDRTECVLSFEVVDSSKFLKGHNFMLLTEPKNSKIVNPNIKVVDVKKNDKTGTFVITLSSEAVAPFVSLDFKLGSGIKGHFSDNGFFIFEKETTLEFYPLYSNFQTDEKHIKDSLVIKTLTDVK